MARSAHATYKQPGAAHVHKTTNYTLTLHLPDAAAARATNAALWAALDARGITRTATVEESLHGGGHSAGVSWRSLDDATAALLANDLLTAAVAATGTQVSRARVHTGYGNHTRVLIDTGAQA